jgi:Casein kinase II regulatory subunit
VLPVSLKDEIRAGPVKIYCPKCSQVYHPPPTRSRSGLSSGVDGAAFGTTFPHLFLMTFSNLVPDPLPVESSYIPRVFGFRLHKSARQKYLQTQAQPQQQQTQQPSVQAVPIDARPDTPRTNEQQSNNSSNQEPVADEKRSRRRKRDAEQPKKEAESKNDGSAEVTIKKRRRNNNTT